MYAGEFITKIENNIVNIPKNYHNLYNEDVQVFIIPINKKKRILIQESSLV